MIKAPINIRSSRHLHKASQRGAQLVEMAIVLPIFLLLLAGTTEFGNYLHTYVTLTRATRVAARHLSARPYASEEIAVAKNLAVCGSTASCSTGTAILTGLTTSNVQVSYTGNSTMPTTITVRIINYSYTPVFDLSRFVGGAAWANVAASPSTTMRYLIWR